MKYFYEYKQLTLLSRLKIHEKIISFIFRLFGYGFGFLTCLTWVTFKGLGIKPEANRQQSFTYEENGEKIYRLLESNEELAEKFNEMGTVTEILLKVLKEGGNRNIIGYRRLIKEHHVTDGITKNSLWELSNYEWISCEEVFCRIMKVCEYLKSLNLNQDRKIAIFAETSQDWLIIAFAVMFLKSVIVTVYPTLTDDNILYAFSITEPVAIVVDSKTSLRIYSMLNRLPFIETIIYTSRCSQDIINNLNIIKYNPMHVDTIYSRTVDAEAVRYHLNPPIPDDLIIIMFTSGSTGIPKGIMIQHRNVVSVIAGSENQRPYWANQTLISYLPLAHILEIICELAIICFGGKIGYGNSSTLFPNGPLLYQGILNDLALLRPTCITVVPMVLERLYKSIMDKLKLAGRLKKLIIQESYNLRAYFHSRGFNTPIINRLIFTKFHTLFGGNLKYSIVGGAYLSPEIEEFFNILFPPFKQAYGTTEICCAGTMSNILYHRPFNIGPPSGCSEIKLVPWVEGGYSVSGLEITKGEILVSGSAVCCGYYKNEKETKEAFVIDPITNKLWYNTADIGEVLSDGCFRIIGRKSEIIKLGHGEFVELPKIESVILGSKYVEYVCLIPSENRNFLIAIISLNMPSLIELAKILGMPDNIPFGTVYIPKDIILAIEADINQIAVKANLNKFEIPKSYILTDEQWNPDSGLLTPSYKIRRAQIKLKYYK